MMSKGDSNVRVVVVVESGNFRAEFTEDSVYPERDTVCGVVEEALGMSGVRVGDIVTIKVLSVDESLTEDEVEQ